MTIRDILKADRLDHVILRIVAIVLLLFALVYWSRLTGIVSGEEYRFDTTGGHWRLAASVLAVAMPITALGLWSGASWGVVIWIPVATVELAMYGWFSSLYGSAGFRVGFHLVAFALYGAVLLWQRYWLTKHEKTGT